MNNDSEGLMNDALNDPGIHLKRSVMKKQFNKNRVTLKRKKVTPIILSHSDWYGTALCQKNPG